MVPLFYDPFTAQFKVLAVVGYTSQKMEVTFAAEPPVAHSVLHRHAARSRTL